MPRIAVQRDVLVVEDGIGIRHRRRHQRARVVRSRRRHDLEAGRAVEPGLGVLAVIGPGVAEPAPRHADDHGHGRAPAVADLGRAVDELVEAGSHEVVELHLADGPLAREGGPDAHPEHTTLRQGRVEDAVAELLEERAQQQEGVAVFPADVLAVDEDARIGAQGFTDAHRHRVEERASARVHGRPRIERRELARARGVPLLEHLDVVPRRLSGQHAHAHHAALGPGRFDDAPRFRLHRRIRLALPGEEIGPPRSCPPRPAGARRW
jgi:hypothetical protein